MCVLFYSTEFLVAPLLPFPDPEPELGVCLRRNSNLEPEYTFGHKGKAKSGLPRGCCVGEERREGRRAAEGGTQQGRAEGTDLEGVEGRINEESI